MRRVARVTWAVAVAAALAPAAPVAAGAAVPACVADASGPIGGPTGGVNVHAAGHVTWCSAAAIAENKDVPDGTGYAVYGAQGGVNGGNEVSNALSVNHLLVLAHIDPATVGFTEIARLDGAWATLETADLADPSSSFQDGLLPVVWIDGNAPWLGTTTRYIRPLRAGDPSDTNAADQISAENGGALDLYVHSGPLLHVTAAASTDHTTPGQAVSFTAHATDATAGDGTIAYQWTFGDGSRGDGSAPTHAFSAAGVYRVIVTAEGDNDSGGAADPLYVTVGSPPPSSGSGGTGGGTSTDPSAPPTGPQASGGTTPGAAAGAGAAGAAPGGSSGTAPTATGHHRQATATPSVNDGTSTSGRASARGTTGASGSGTAAGTGAAQTTGPPTGVGAASVAATPTPAADATPPRAPGAAAQGHARRPPRHVTASPGRNVVRGRLLAAVRLVPVASLSPAAPADGATAHAPAAQAPERASLATWIGGAAVIILLLGAGAVAELRARRRWGPPVPATR